MALLAALLLLAAQASEQVAPGHSVTLRPGGLVALDPEGDRFDLELTRAPGGPASYHLRLALASGAGPLLERTLRVPAAGGHATARLELGLPVLATLRHCRLGSLVPRWECAGFTLDVELREGGPDGPLVHALHDPDRTIGISWTGLAGRIAWPLALAGVALGLALARRTWRAAEADLWTFDVLTLGALLSVPAAFSAFAAPAVPLLALLLARTPAKVRAAAGAALRRGELFPGLAAATLALVWLSFHHLLALAHDVHPVELDPHLALIAGLYLLAGLAASWWLHAGTPHPLLAGLLLAVLPGTLRRIDGATFLLTGGHADGELWRHLFHATNLTLASSPLVVGLLASLLAETALVMALAQRARRRPARGLQAVPVALLVVALVQIGLRAGQAPRRELSDTVREAFAALPEWAMAGPLLAAAFADETPPPPLDPALLAKLRHAGLRPGALRADYPLLRRGIHLAPPDPARDTPRVPPGTNLIVVLVESLSAGLLEHGVPGLTPNLDAFAAESLSFDELWAAEFPTLRGELASFASFAFGDDAGGTLLPGRSPTDTRLLTLAEVLRGHGYSTVHAQSDHGTFAGTTRLFLRSGWDRALSADDPRLREGAAHPVEKTWGLYDEDLFRGVAGMLEDGSLAPPFLLTLATTDTHYPYAVLRRHPGAGGHDLLDALHSTDAGFGLFWERFRRSPRAADTLLLVTADHALAGRTLRRAGGAPRLSRFDRLAGWLYVPGGRWQGARSAVLCSQLDLTPTLLDVLGIDVENPFLGLSIFSDRPAHPLLPGREQPPLHQLSPRDRARLGAVGWTDGDQARWLDYLTRLARSGRVHPRPST